MRSDKSKPEEPSQDRKENATISNSMRYRFTASSTQLMESDDAASVEELELIGTPVKRKTVFHNMPGTGLL